MRQRLTVLLYLLMLLPVANGSALAQSRGVNYISDIDGQAEVNGNRAYVGDFLRPSDRLRVRSGGNVGVVCNNETRERRFPLGTYTISDYCTGTPPRSSGRRRPPRDFDSQLPYVISPRNTALLDGGQPTIRWNPVEGAQSYSVVLFTDNSGEPVWTAPQVSATEVRYSGPELRRDLRYRLEITADNGLSSRADIAVGFTLLSQSEAERVEQEVLALAEMNLAPDAEALGLALIYQGYEHEDSAQNTNLPLNQAALEVLQERIDADTDNALIYVMQGDIYLSIGLPLLAQERYRQALALATETGQLQGQAGSWDGLALLAQGRGDVLTAIAQTEQALALYDVMGDVDQVSTLEERLAFLESQL